MTRTHSWRMHRPRARRARAGAHGGGPGRIHLPDASRGPPGPARELPHLRHGARTAERRRGGGRQRAARHDPTAVRERGPLRAAGRVRDAAPRSPRAPLARPRPVGRRALDRAGPRHAGGPVGWLALLRARVALAAAPQPEHVHADRPRGRRRVPLQPGRGAGAGRIPRPLPRRDGPRRRLLRGRRRHRHPGPPRPGARAACAPTHGRGHPRAARPRSADRPARRGRRVRARGAAGRGPTRRPAARAARGQGAGGRHGRGRQQRRGRVDGHRRAHPGREAAGRPGGGRHRERNGDARDPRGARGGGHAAGQDRGHGRAGPAQPRSHPASGGPGLRLVRAGGGRRRRADVRGLGPRRSRAPAGLRDRQRRCRADRGLPLRARPGHADVGDGGHRARAHRPACSSATPRPSRRCAASTRWWSTRRARSRPASRGW